MLEPLLEPDQVAGRGWSIPWIPTGQDGDTGREHLPVPSAPTHQTQDRLFPGACAPAGVGRSSSMSSVGNLCSPSPTTPCAPPQGHPARPKSLRRDPKPHPAQGSPLSQDEFPGSETEPRMRWGLWGCSAQPSALPGPDCALCSHRQSEGTSGTTSSPCCTR